jgi:hypothetical protein
MLKRLPQDVTSGCRLNPVGPLIERLDTIQTVATRNFDRLFRSG